MDYYDRQNLAGEAAREVLGDDQYVSDFLKNAEDVRIFIEMLQRAVQKGYEHARKGF